MTKRLFLSYEPEIFFSQWKNSPTLSLIRTLLLTMHNRCGTGEVSFHAHDGNVYRFSISHVKRMPRYYLELRPMAHRSPMASYVVKMGCRSYSIKNNKLSFSKQFSFRRYQPSQEPAHSKTQVNFSSFLSVFHFFIYCSLLLSPLSVFEGEYVCVTGSVNVFLNLLQHFYTLPSIEEEEFALKPGGGFIAKSIEEE